MADDEWIENVYTGGWISVVSGTWTCKYFLVFIYRSGFKVYVGAGLALYWAGTLNEPAVTINDLAFNVPFCFGVQLSREESPTIEIEIKFDSPVFDAVAEPPATVPRKEAKAHLGGTFISINWKGVF